MKKKSSPKSPTPKGGVDNLDIWAESKQSKNIGFGLFGLLQKLARTVVHSFNHFIVKAPVPKGLGLFNSLSNANITTSLIVASGV